MRFSIKQTAEGKSRAFGAVIGAGDYGHTTFGFLFSLLPENMLATAFNVVTLGLKGSRFSVHHKPEISRRFSERVCVS